MDRTERRKHFGQKEIFMSLAAKLAAIALGNALYALAVVCFIIPNGLITGGTTGLGLFVNRMSGLPVSVFVILFNGAMFLLGAVVLGKQFVIQTALSTVLYPLILGILERMGIRGFVLEEKLVAVLYAGMLIGAGIGIVMRAGGSTGGLDIPALILKKKWRVNVSVAIYCMDCVILGLQMMGAERSAILYGGVLILVYTLVLDRVLAVGTKLPASDGAVPGFNRQG